MTTDEFKKLRLYADQRLSEAGLRANKYGQHVYSILRFAETEEQVDDAIEQLQRNCPKWWFYGNETKQRKRQTA